MTRIKFARRSGFGLLAAVAVSVIGCGEPRTVPISPRFLVDGQPLASASVTFIRQGAEGGRAAFGVTDAEGKASLTTFKPHDGVAPGDYRVVVVQPPDDPHTYAAADAASDTPEAVVKQSAMAGKRLARRAKRVRTLLPEIYADPGTTPLMCSVSGSSDDLVFEIDSRAEGGR